ncbi:acetyltransferase [Streptomyces bingchenggensis BCW-1]|uniref:Acetyltransferase n=1 Tax=Streptomyces bingchenggensis (strain BCW-1) TaxID=749414 RepID=D7BVQ1_STRBB|nr:MULTISPECIES: GNAT family N-acetyltransferase [Streptomyces]ADI09630.1 acetyltransferase [Streptomyces bingchenggensis BCW-1]
MLTLRELAVDDSPAIRRIYSGASVRFTHGYGYQMTDEDACRRIAKALESARIIPRPCWDFGIAVVGDVIGMISLRVREPGLGAVSYILREDCWGNGYATQAAKRVVDFAFTELKRLEAKHHPDNPASGRVLAKAGFTCLGSSGLHAEDGVVASCPVYEIRRP